ncbi:MAG: cupredoxin domain-containing protein [Gammaproteobacteria bacterium]
MIRIMIMLVGLLLAGAGVAPATAADAAPAPRVHVIVVDKMEYGPIPADIHAGDTIEWVNRDLFEHTATARDGSFDVDLKPDTTVRMTAKKGTVALFCKFHPTMEATLVVK